MSLYKPSPSPAGQDGPHGSPRPGSAVTFHLNTYKAALHRRSPHGLHPELNPPAVSTGHPLHPPRHSTCPVSGSPVP